MKLLGCAEGRTGLPEASFVRAPHDLVNLIIRYVRISVLHRERYIALVGLVGSATQTFLFTCKRGSKAFDGGGQLIGRQ